MTAFIPSSMTPFLQTLEARSQLTQVERQIILDLPFAPQHVRANQDFVQKGEAVTNSCFILEGFVGTFGQNRRGERQITSVFLTGEMIDLNTVVVPEAIASIQALTPTTILRVPHAALRAAAGGHPGISEAFWRECVIAATLFSEWVVNVGRRDARSRLAHLFCEIACRSGHRNADDSFRFPFPITQAQLADMVGLTPVHVNRTLSGLREDGIVEISLKTAHIMNWNRLAQIGEFDPSYLRLDSAGRRRQHPAMAGPPPTQSLQ